MSARVFLTSEDVVARWNGALTTWTLERWRSRGTGPRFTKMGSRVVYALSDIESFEAESRHLSTRRKAGASGLQT
jgi:hypothetical protein